MQRAEGITSRQHLNAHPRNPLRTEIPNAHNPYGRKRGIEGLPRQRGARPKTGGNKFSATMRRLLVQTVLVMVVMDGLFVFREGSAALTRAPGATIAGGLFHT